MTAYLNDPNQLLSKAMSTKGVLVALYSTVLLTGLALCVLLIAVPMLLKEMEVLSREWEHDFETVKVSLN